MALDTDDSQKSTKPPYTAFPAYLASSSLWVSALSLEILMVTWIFLGVLKESAAIYGNARALISSVPLVVLLVGGLVADRVEARLYLIAIALVTACVPMVLIAFLDGLLVWHVIAFGIAVAMLNAMGEPARQAAVNRITRADIQRTIAVIAIVPSLLSMVSMSFFAHLESKGLMWVLVTLSSIFALSGFALIGLPRLPPAKRPKLELAAGFAAALKIPLVRDLLAMNFVSSIFNAGGYIVGVQVIATNVYGGGPAFLASVSLVFLLGSVASNFLLLLFMPFKRPGQIYVLLQFTRMLLLVFLILHPVEWIFLGLIGCWGLNMGVTTTLMRSCVQELAPERHRAQILSLLLLSFMLASPISSLALGHLIDWTSPLVGLVPGVVLSLVLFVWGWKFSGVWNYQSDSAVGYRSWASRVIS